MKKGVLPELTAFIILIVVVVAFSFIIGVFHFFGAKITKDLVVNVIYEPVSTQDALLSLMNLRKDYVVETSPAEDFSWEKRLYSKTDTDGNGDGGGSAVLALPSRYDKVVLERAWFDDEGYANVNGQRVFDNNDPCCCQVSDLYPNKDITSYVHAGDNTIYGYADDNCPSNAYVEVRIHVYKNEFVKRVYVTFAKAIVYGLYENTMTPKVFSDGYVVDFDIKKEAESYLKYVYPDKKYWLFLYDPATGIKIDLVKNAKDEDFDREPYGSRDSVPLKPENYWLVLYVAK